ncbi:MAG TPA: SUF system NifU family Fe-S cluster assembly protein [Kofleriaceae bacterium]|nr:SUF system NifU family Fe-S cluster assembly protein [Kofleriaceae bacterium]
MSTRDLYQALIVEHDRHPRNERPLPAATHEATIDNPMCGDVVTVRMIIDGDVVRDVAFEAKGCALSRAAASLMTERVRGARVDTVRPLAAQIEALVRADPEAPIASDLGDLGALAGVRRFKSRRSCATLPFQALIASLGQCT